MFLKIWSNKFHSIFSLELCGKDSSVGAYMTTWPLQVKAKKYHLPFFSYLLPATLFHFSLNKFYYNKKIIYKLSINGLFSHQVTWQAFRTSDILFFFVSFVVVCFQSISVRMLPINFFFFCLNILTSLFIHIHTHNGDGKLTGDTHPVLFKFS